MRFQFSCLVQVNTDPTLIHYWNRGISDYNLKALKYYNVNRGDKWGYSIWNHRKCLVISFRFISIPMLWVYEHYKYFTPSVWGSTSLGYILTSKTVTALEEFKKSICHVFLLCHCFVCRLWRLRPHYPFFVARQYKWTFLYLSWDKHW